MLTPRSKVSVIDTANPTVPVVVIPAPDPGVTNIIYSVMLMNADTGARDLDFYLTDGVKVVYLIQERGVVWTTRYQYPPEDCGGELHQVAGWDLMMVTDGFTAGASWCASADYAEDRGVNGEASDYRWALSTPDAAGGQWEMLGEPDADRVRIVKHMSISNQDTPTPGLGVHSWFIGKSDGVATAWCDITANMNVRDWLSWWGCGGRTILEPGDSLVGFQVGAENTTPSPMGISYLDAGGVPNVQFGAEGYSDVGPWVRSSVAAFHGQCIEFAGLADRLMTVSTIQALGIVDSWTVAAWVKPQDNNRNTQWVFMHGHGGGGCPIHLYRDTQQATNPWRIHIRNLAADDKDYRFGHSLALDVWYLIACTWDGTTLKCYVDGVLQTIDPADKVLDDVFTIPMVDSNRAMSIGGISQPTDSDGFEGRVSFAGSWSSVLTAAELAWLYANGQADWRIDAGDYASKANNEHYYICGKYGPPDMGHDFGLGGNTFDLYSENSLDASDIVDDAPGV